MTKHNVYFMDKNYNLQLISDAYCDGGIYFGLIDANDGEPYVDITTNISPYTDDDMIALDNDFMSCCSPQLINDVIAELTDGFAKKITSGYVDFPIFYLKKDYYAKEDKSND